MGKEIFDLKSPAWSWHEVPGDVREYLCSQARFDSDTLIKINPVRAVFACGDYFVKFQVPDTALRRWRSILAPQGAGEYAAGMALTAAGVPVVEYLGWMRRAAVNAVVSRRWPGGGESAESRLYRELFMGGADREQALAFARGLRSFVLKFQEAGFRHPDFHCGNILCGGSGTTFALVDVYGVKKSRLSWADRRIQDEILMPLRRVLGIGDFLDLLGGMPDLSGRGAPEEFRLTSLRREAARLQREWPRRRRQIMAGYPKFMKMDGDLVIMRDPLRRNLFSAEEEEAGNHEILELPEEEAATLFMASVYWQMCRLPHRRVVALRRPGRIYLEAMPGIVSAKSAGVPEEDAASFREELALFGVSDPGEIACDRRGRLRFVEIERALAGMPEWFTA